MKDEKNPKSRANVITRPNKKTTISIKKETDRLFGLFSVPYLSAETGIKETSIRSMKFRSKVSQEAAMAFCKLKQVIDSGFTRESLRPDLKVTDWVRDGSK